MAQVKKLMISGIRSFDPNGSNKQMIEFYSPMTLIVGQNGCGKTTIIEALKFAITQDYPPGTNRGQSFVNDPKLSAGYEVNAKVQLELEEKNGTKVVVTRRLKSSQKGKNGAISCQLLEGTIRRIVNGQKIDMSSKCSDMKNEMCRLMGVSEAILNNVIFCHQEDSCWPLTEGKKVKEKFDAIFNTTMYMKALDVLTAKFKELGGDIKEANGRLEGTTALMQELKMKKKNIEKTNVELVSMCDLIAKQEAEAKEMSVKLKAFEELEKEYAKVSSAVATTKEKINGIQRAIAETKKNITEVLPGSLTELKTALKNFETMGREEQKKLRDLNAELARKEEEFNSLTSNKNKLLKEEGGFQEQETQNTKRVANLKTLIGEVLSKIKRMKENSQDESFSASVDSVLETEVSDVTGENILKALASGIKAKEAERIRSIADFAGREKVLQNKLDELGNSKGAVEAEIRLKRKAIDDNTDKIEDLSKKLQSIQGSGEALALLADDEENWTKTIETIQKSGIIGKLEAEVTGFSAEIKKLEERRTVISKEMKILREDQGVSEKIGILKNHVTARSSECNEIKRRIEDSVVNLMQTFPENNLGLDLEKKIASLAKEVKEMQETMTKKKVEVSTKEGEDKMVGKELDEKEKTLREWKEQINEVFDGTDFDAALEEAKAAYDSAQKDSYYNEAAQYLFNKYIQKLRGRKKDCPLCKRDFSDKQQKLDLATEIEAEVTKLQENEETDKQKVEKMKERQEALAELKPLWEQVKTFETTTIPALKQSKTGLEGKITSLRENIEALGDSFEVLSSDLAQARNLVKDASRYDEGQAFMKKTDVLIKHAEKTRNPAVQDCTMSFAEADNEQESLEGTLSAKRMEKDSKETMRNSKRDELSAAESKRNQIKERILRITTEMKNREAFETQKKTLEETTKEFESAISDLNKKIPQLNSEIGSWDRKKAELAAEKESALKVIQGGMNELEERRRNVAEMNKQIELFETVIKPRFAEKQRQMAQCKRKLDDVDNVRQDLGTRIAELNTQISNQQVKKRNLDDNISVKEKEIEMRTQVAELGTKEAALAASQNRGVATEKRELQSKYNELFRNMNRNEGTRSGLQKTLAEVRNEIKEDPYRTLEEDHCRNYVRKEVLTRAQKDIRLYKTALDNAIMQFHHKKMQTINKYLEHLWRKVYQGNDIDYIQIRTDNEDPAAADDNFVKVTAKKKVYNYRVVMIRTGIELDMRGRCSAGQKVLACIIIRMALAQTFSTKCGIITLDEPTTNLDQRNIDSLATTLSQISTQMRAMKTFQLVVITHDQDFIEKLMVGDPCDFFFKVSRDRQGYSQIERIRRD